MSTDTPERVDVALAAARLLHATTAPVVYLAALHQHAEQHARDIGIPQRRVCYVNRADRMRGLHGAAVVIELDSARRIRTFDRDEILYRLDTMRAAGYDVIHIVEGSPEETALRWVLARQREAANGGVDRG